jgi:5-methylcytosine-specific restriction endonuclease McrA
MIAHAIICPKCGERQPLPERAEDSSVAQWEVQPVQCGFCGASKPLAYWQRCKQVGSRAAARRRSRPDMGAAKRERALTRCQGRCAYCGRSIARSIEFVADHITPLARGGDNADANVVAACRACNQLKGDKTPDEFAEHIFTEIKRRLMAADALAARYTRGADKSELHCALLGVFSRLVESQIKFERPDLLGLAEEVIRE